MKHNRLTTLLLALVVAFSLTVTVSAADDAVLTRGEFVTALYGASGTTGTSPAQYVFSDVQAEGTLAQAVSWAADNGIVNGLGDGRFGPEDPVTREQMVTMLYRFAQSLVDSTCTENEYGMFTGVTGERRVKNVLVGGEPIDPDRTYTLAAHNYMLLQHGDGYTMFDSAPLLLDGIKLDNQLLIDYIVDVLGGVIGEEYADPYSQGRITFTSHDN